MAVINVPGCQCDRCGHTWAPMGEQTPKVCPRCKSPYWNTPRKEGEVKKPATAISSVREASSAFIGELATQWEGNGFGHLIGLNADRAKAFEDEYVARWNVPPGVDLARYVIAEGAAAGARNWAFVDKVLQRGLEHGGVPPKLGGDHGRKPAGVPARHPQTQGDRRREEAKRRGFDQPDHGKPVKPA